MSTRIVQVLVAISLAPSGAYAQEQADACEGPEYREFDFWVGEWRVENADGGLAGTNRIERILGDCAVRESWEGAGGGKGFSYNIYDAQTGNWHQTWVDDRGRLLQLDGTLEDGKMVLSGERPGPDGSLVLHRISWEAIEGGRVRQIWAVSQDEGGSWRTVFDGMYIPVEKGG